jgi:TolA-binding protein
MKPCEQLESFLDGALMTREREAFVAHTAVCGGCRSAVGAWPQVKVRLLDWNDTALGEPTSADVTQLLRRATLERRSKDPVSWRWGMAAAFLVSTTAAATAWIMVTGEGVVPSLRHSRVEQRAAIDSPSSDRPMGDAIAPEQEVLTAPPGARLLIERGLDRIAIEPGGRVRIEAVLGVVTKIHLEAGALATDVAPRVKGQRALTVVVGGCEVRVMGTRFGVALAASGEIAVFLDGGHIRVATGGRQYELSAQGRLDSGCQGEATVRELAKVDQSRMAALLAPDAQPEVRTTPPGTGRPRRHDSNEPPGESLDAALERWRTWIVAGRLADAERALVEHLRLNPADAPARSLLADCQRKAGRWTDAVATLREVARADDTLLAARARYMAAVLLQDELKDHRAAVDLLRSYLALPGGYASLASTAKVRLGRSLLALGEPKEAALVLEAVIQEWPETSDAREARALLDKERRSTSQ